LSGSLTRKSEEDAVIDSPTSVAIAEEAERYIPGGVNSNTRRLDPPVVFRRAEGAYLWDADGNEHLDYHAAFGPIVLGHNHPKVTEAVVDAVRTIDIVGAGVTELEVKVARKVVEHVPAAEKVLLCNTGSEANYNAVRLARAVTGRKRLIKFQGLYHGIHDDLLMNVISPPERVGRLDPGSTGALPEVLEQTIVLPFNDVGALRTTIEEKGDEIAAVFLETIPHNVGCMMPKPEFLRAMRELTQRAGIILVFDEVITGFRHGLGGYQAAAGVTPDLTTMAKAIANGFPCAAIGGRQDLMERFATAGGDVFYAGTYNGHPVGTAAALATIDALEDDGVYEHTFGLCERLARGLEEIAEELGVEMTVARYGSVFVPYFMSGPIERYEDLLRNDGERDVRFRRGMMGRGVFMIPLPMKRNHVSAAHTGEDVDRTLDAAQAVLREITA